VATHFVLDNNFPVLALGVPWPRSVRVTDLRVASWQGMAPREMIEREEAVIGDAEAPVLL